MILKYKYHSDSGLLEAFRSYTLAQNNSLSDSIVITSTAADADKYNYCLEFICYNSKSIPKAQYISPILSYSDGLTFAIPNSLTQFRGHVDMQLTGYDPDDNSIVFKSIAKNCKAFDVEGSLGVLEKDVNETPNVLTEVMEQLAKIKDVRQDIIDEAMRSFSEQMLEIISAYKWCKVRFVDRGKLIEEKPYLKGSKIVAPQYTLPNGCVLVDGWYDPATNRIWDIENDTVQDDVTLYLNYMSEGIAISNGAVTNINDKYTVYVPEYYGGKKVEGIKKIYVNHSVVLYLGNNTNDIFDVFYNSSIRGIYFPSDNKSFYSYDGAIYVDDGEQKMLAYVPNCPNNHFVMREGFEIIYADAICARCDIKRLSLPNSLLYLSESAIVDTDLEILTLPKNVLIVEDFAVCNNKKLTKIFFEGDVPQELSDSSFVCTDSQKNVTYRPTLYVKPQYYLNFKKCNLSYEIKVIGEDYYDEKYVEKAA